MLRQPFSQEKIDLNKWDVIVIGAGAAGLMTCLELIQTLHFGPIQSMRIVCHSPAFFVTLLLGATTAYMLPVN